MVVKSDDQHWTLDKRIPVALLVTMMGQLVVGIIAGTLLYADVRDHGHRLERLEVKDRQDDAKAADLGIAVVRLQEATVTLREAVVDLRSTFRAPAQQFGAPR